MSTEWILEVFKQQQSKKKDLLNDRAETYLQDNKLFVCDCSCQTVWQRSWYGKIDKYKDFPTIGKKIKRIPGHEKGENNEK